MARQALKVEAYIELNEKETVLWYTIDENGTVTWFLPKDKEDALKKIMLDRAGRRMSDYIANHPEAGLWGRTNNA